MASFSSDAFDSTNAFDTDAWDFDSVSASVATDGGCLWPPRLEDARWSTFMTNQGVTPSRSSIANDVREALGNALGYPATKTVKMSIDDIWKRYLISQGKVNYSSEDDFP